MKKDELATVKLFRFDPETEGEPRYVKFKVPYKGYTVKDVLRYIYENLDSTFAFRWACGKGLCRCCGVSVNGRPVLSCMELASADMKIDPHPKFQVLKDLVVDFDQPK